MVVIYRTKNGWLLHHGSISWVKWPEITPEILTFHSNEGLMDYLQGMFGQKQERDAKGHFISNKNHEAEAEKGGRGKHQNPDLPHMRKG